MTSYLDRPVELAGWTESWAMVRTTCVFGPEACAEGAIDCLGGVAAALGHRQDRVLLLEGQARRELPEPLASLCERSSALVSIAVGSDVPR
jgi:hypothetical protein